MPQLEYIIYADESRKRGPLFSNFYGGLLVSSLHMDTIRQELERVKDAERLGREIKWGRISENYEAKYLAVLRAFFDMVDRDLIKIRIMFTQNIHVPILTPE